MGGGHRGGVVRKYVPGGGGWLGAIVTEGRWEREG